jgi:magnesium transporter
MYRTSEWIDLLDPTDEQLREAWPTDVHPQAIETLLQPHTHADEPRPKIESHGTYAFAVLLVPVVVQAEDRVYYREVDMLITHDHVLTVRKTPPDGSPLDLTPVQEICKAETPAGMIAYRIVDEVAEGFLDMIDDVHGEIDELEDNVDVWDNDTIRRRLSDLRHDLLHIRRTLAPTRDAVRRVIDDRVELDDEELFPHDVELHFGDAFDKLLRSSEGLETARDLIGGVRDYHQSKVANDQNEVMKRLTLVASIFLPPTFVVGLYGQNFVTIPELHWAQGYGFSWALILISTIGQLIYFRRRGWL